MNFRPVQLRMRLTLWYACVFGAVLLLFIAGASFLQNWQLGEELSHSEIQDMETAEGLLYFTPSGSIAMHEEYHNSLQDKMRVNRLMEVMTPTGASSLKRTARRTRFRRQAFPR